MRDRITGETARVSLANDGTQANSLRADPALSADGRYVAFLSTASNLTAGDTNATDDVFVHDRQAGETARVSVASDGTQANSSSDNPYLSADGRYVAFRSFASNLVPGDTNDSADAFVHDRATSETIRVSVAGDGSQSNSGVFAPDSVRMSADGRYISFLSLASNLVADDTNGVADTFVHARVTGETTRVSVATDGSGANGASSTATLSADGRYAAFQSSASNLVAGDTNRAGDVFVTTGRPAKPRE